MDLSATVAPRSDQTNYDDMIGGPMTITITKVTTSGGPDQPVSIHYEGDNSKPWKPCKSMRRVLVHVWGKDGAAYVGRRLTLFGDPTVRFGGAEVGGIRISHMSHIDRAQTMALTTTRGKRAPYTVKPLAPPRDPPPRTAAASPPGEAGADVSNPSLEGTPRETSAPGAFPGDGILYVGERYDPAQPCELIPPVDLAEMSATEAREWATALAELMKASAAPRDWYDANTAHILKLKARGPQLAARLEELARGEAA